MVANARFNKIFGLGLTKSGTTSLNDALNLIGIPSAHWIHDDYFEHVLQTYTGICDMPVTTRYRELDRRFPGSRFILTARAFDDWLDSCRRWYLSHPAQEGQIAQYRIELYGTPHFDPVVFTRVYHRHHAEVEEYFRGREGDLLKMDIGGGQEWEALLPFLGRPPLELAFPHSNKGDL